MAIAGKAVRPDVGNRVSSEELLCAAKAADKSSFGATRKGVVGGEELAMKRIVAPEPLSPTTPRVAFASFVRETLSAAAARARRAAAASTLGHAHSRYRRSTEPNAASVEGFEGFEGFEYAFGSRRVGGRLGIDASGGGGDASLANAALAAGAVGAATERPDARTARNAIAGAPNRRDAGCNASLVRHARSVASALRWHAAVAASASHGRNR